MKTKIQIVYYLEKINNMKHLLSLDGAKCFKCYCLLLFQGQETGG